MTAIDEARQIPRDRWRRMATAWPSSAPGAYPPTTVWWNTSD